MTLTNRLTLFFLATLALVLAGFSTTLYCLARAYLHRQTEERLESALNTLVAAAEVEPDGVEWEPAERRLALGPMALEDQPVWLVSGSQGEVVDGSEPRGAHHFLAVVSETLQTDPLHSEPLDWQGERWQFGQRRLHAANPSAVTSTAGSNNKRMHPSLTITAGVPLAPVQATLRQLAGVLAGLSLAVWLVALIAGRVLCRRGLLPLSRMASAARDMDAVDLQQRLPVAASLDELGELSKAFNCLLDRVQESFERQRRFTGDASHQLRTPLAAVLGQVEVALRGERPAEEYRRVLATVRQQALHLRQIVESLLFLARADAEAVLPQREPVDLAAWLPRHLRTLFEHPRGKDILLEMHDRGSLEVTVQPALLAEMVDILLSNACKFSPAGTPITARLARQNSDASLTVQDEGCGIAEEDMPRLFSPFFRSADARSRGIEGVGLGLSIARRLAMANGGSLHAESHLGRGSSFTLRLPAS